MFDDFGKVLKNVVSVVNEVRDADLSTMDRLLGSLSTETDMCAGNAGLVEEAVMFEPLLGPALDAGSAFRDDPHTTLEEFVEPLKGSDRPCHYWRPHRLLQPAGQKGRVVAARMAGTVIDHSTEIDSKNRAIPHA